MSDQPHLTLYHYLGCPFCSMVERVIGRRVGTGGSAGVDYLDTTALQYRVFKEIWAARTMLLSPQQAPHTDDEAFYGLRAGE